MHKQEQFKYGMKLICMWFFYYERKVYMKAKRELKNQIQETLYRANCRSDISKNSIKTTSFIYIYMYIYNDRHKTIHKGRRSCACILDIVE